jgi:hypothetical protein
MNSACVCYCINTAAAQRDHAWCACQAIRTSECDDRRTGRDAIAANTNGVAAIAEVRISAVYLVPF